MKRQNAKGLSLNKKSISNLESFKAGLSRDTNDCPDTMTCPLWSCANCTDLTNDTCRNYCNSEK
ncbi:hypothetical protein [Kordia sp.]|uniref:hypothetical protein n=1 Tax=Kordia sp. TaxID=1965332 RepID=UPI003B5B2460